MTMAPDTSEPEPGARPSSTGEIAETLDSAVSVEGATNASSATESATAAPTGTVEGLVEGR